MRTSGAIELEWERRDCLAREGLSWRSQLGTHWLIVLERIALKMKERECYIFLVQFGVVLMRLRARSVLLSH